MVTKKRISLKKEISCKWGTKKNSKGEISCKKKPGRKKS